MSIPDHVEAQVQLETELSEKLKRAGVRMTMAKLELTKASDEAIELCYQLRQLDDPVQYEYLVDWCGLSKSTIINKVKRLERLRQDPNSITRESTRKLNELLDEYNAQS